MMEFLRSGTMRIDNEREPGTARVLFDQFKINNREIDAAVMKGLMGEGFDVEIEPDFKLGDMGYPPMPEGSTIKVYRKVSNYA